VQRNAVQKNSLNVTMQNGYGDGSSDGIQPNGAHMTGYQKVVIGSFTTSYSSRVIARVVLLFIEFKSLCRGKYWMKREHTLLPSRLLLKMKSNS
jgi:hypothetical protein